MNCKKLVYSVCLLGFFAGGAEALNAKDFNYEALAAAQTSNTAPTPPNPITPDPSRKTGRAEAQADRQAGRDEAKSNLEGAKKEELDARRHLMVDESRAAEDRRTAKEDLEKGDFKGAVKAEEEAKSIEKEDKQERSSIRSDRQEGRQDSKDILPEGRESAREDRQTGRQSSREDRQDNRQDQQDDTSDNEKSWWQAQ